MIRQTPHKQASVESPCEKVRPAQDLSLEETTILCRDHLRFRTCKLQNTCMYDMWGDHKTDIQYGDLTAECKKLKETTFSVLKPNFDLWHHIYHTNYKTVTISESWPSRNIMACATISPNMVRPNNLLRDGKKLNRGENTFCQRNRMLTHLWNDKW